MPISAILSTDFLAFSIVFLSIISSFVSFSKQSNFFGSVILGIDISERIFTVPYHNNNYKFFKYNGKVVDIFDFEEDYLNIFSREILRQIKRGESNWQKNLPGGIADLIMKNEMFGITG